MEETKKENTRLSFLSPVMRQYTCIQIALFNVVLLGMNNVWASPMVVKLKDPEQDILSRPITDDEAAWIVSIFLLGGITVPAYSGFLMNKFGRKTTLIISNVPRLMFCFLAVFATEYWMLLVARFLGGVSDFLLLSVVSTYSSEIANKKIRGQSGTMIQINSASGMLIMFSLGPYLPYRTMNIVMTGMAILCCIPLLMLPESPFFLYTTGKINKAVEMLTFLHGSEDAANNEITEYTSKNTEDEVVVDKWAMFKDKVVIKSFVIVIILSCIQPFLGYATVNSYLQTIFEMANTTISSEISSVIIGVVQLLACSCAFLMTKRFARKKIICITLGGMVIGHVGLSLFFTVMENGREITGVLNYIPLISAAIVIIGFNAGMGSIFWMLLAEILYGPVRAYGISLAVFLSSVASFLVNLFFPTMSRVLGTGGTFWIFTFGCAFTCIYIAFCVPETKDKTFAEIQTALGRSDKKKPTSEKLIV